MSKINDGGRAFPRAAFTAPGAFEDGYVNPPEDGMSLRDYFAAKAMQGMMAALPAATLTEMLSCPKIMQGIAGAAYGMADHMRIVRTMEMRQPEPALTE
jgi:hypothetical protein